MNKKHSFLVLIFIFLLSTSFLFGQTRGAWQYDIEYQIFDMFGNLVVTYEQSQFDEATGGLLTATYPNGTVVTSVTQADLNNDELFTGYTIKVKLTQWSGAHRELVKFDFVQFGDTKYPAGTPQNLMDLADEVDGAGVITPGTGIWTAEYTILKGELFNGKATIVMYDNLSNPSMSSTENYLPYYNPPSTQFYFRVTNHYDTAKAIVVSANTAPYNSMGFAYGDANNAGVYTDWAPDVFNRDVFIAPRTFSITTVIQVPDGSLNNREDDNGIPYTTRFSDYYIDTTDLFTTTPDDVYPITIAAGDPEIFRKLTISIAFPLHVLLPTLEHGDTVRLPLYVDDYDDAGLTNLVKAKILLGYIDVTLDLRTETIPGHVSILQDELDEDNPQVRSYLAPIELITSGLWDGANLSEDILKQFPFSLSIVDPMAGFANDFNTFIPFSDLDAALRPYSIYFQTLSTIRNNPLGHVVTAAFFEDDAIATGAYGAFSATPNTDFTATRWDIAAGHLVIDYDDAAPLNDSVPFIRELDLSWGDSPATIADMIDDLETILLLGVNYNFVLVYYVADDLGNLVEHRIYTTLLLDAPVMDPVVIYDNDLIASYNPTTPDYTIWNDNPSSSTPSQTAFVWDAPGAVGPVWDKGGDLPISHTNFSDRDFDFYFAWEYTIPNSTPSKTITTGFAKLALLATDTDAGFEYDDTGAWESDTTEEFPNPDVFAGTDTRFGFSINNQWLIENVLADSILVNYYKEELWYIDYTDPLYADIADFRLNFSYTDMLDQLFHLHGGKIIVAVVPRTEGWMRDPESYDTTLRTDVDFASGGNIILDVTSAPPDLTDGTPITLLTAGPEIMAYMVLDIPTSEILVGPPDYTTVSFIVKDPYQALDMLTPTEIANYVEIWSQFNNGYDYSNNLYNRVAEDRIEIDTATFIKSIAFDGPDLISYIDSVPMGVHSLANLPFATDTDVVYYVISFAVQEQAAGRWADVFHFGFDLTLRDQYGHPSITKDFYYDLSAGSTWLPDHYGLLQWAAPDYSGNDHKYSSYHNVGENILPGPNTFAYNMPPAAPDNYVTEHKVYQPLQEDLFANITLGPAYDKFWELEFTLVEFAPPIEQIIYWMPMLSSLATFYESVLLLTLPNTTPVQLPTWEELNDYNWWVDTVENVAVLYDYLYDNGAPGGLTSPAPYNNLEGQTKLNFAGLMAAYGYTSFAADFATLSDIWTINPNLEQKIWSEEVLLQEQPTFLERAVEYANTKYSAGIIWDAVVMANNVSALEFFYGMGDVGDFFVTFAAAATDYPLWTNDRTRPYLGDINGKNFLGYVRAASLGHEEYFMLDMTPVPPEEDKNLGTLMAFEPVNAKFTDRYSMPSFWVERVAYLANYNLFEKESVDLTNAILENTTEFDFHLKIQVGTIQPDVPAENYDFPTGLKVEIGGNTFLELDRDDMMDLMYDYYLTDALVRITPYDYITDLNLDHVLTVPTVANNWTWELLIPFSWTSAAGSHIVMDWPTIDWTLYPDGYVNLPVVVTVTNAYATPFSYPLTMVYFREPWRVATSSAGIDLAGSGMTVQPEPWFIPEDYAYMNYNYFTVDVNYTTLPGKIFPDVDAEPYSSLWGQFDNYVDTLNELWIPESDYHSAGPLKEGAWTTGFDVADPFNREPIVLATDRLETELYRHDIEWLITNKTITTPAVYPANAQNVPPSSAEESIGAIVGPDGYLINNLFADGGPINYELWYDAYKQLYERRDYTHFLLADKDFPIYLQVDAVLDVSGLATYGDITNALTTAKIGTPQMQPVTLAGGPGELYYDALAHEYYMPTGQSIYLRLVGTDAPGFGIYESYFAQWTNADWVLEVWDNAGPAWIALNGSDATILADIIADPEGYYYFQLTPNDYTKALTETTLTIPLNTITDYFGRSNYDGVKTPPDGVSGTRYLPTAPPIVILFAPHITGSDVGGIVVWEYTEDWDENDYRYTFSSPYVKSHVNMQVDLKDISEDLPLDSLLRGIPGEKIIQIAGISSVSSPIALPIPDDQWINMVQYNPAAVPGDPDYDVWVVDQDFYSLNPHPLGWTFDLGVDITLWGYVPVHGDFLGLYYRVGTSYDNTVVFPLIPGDMDPSTITKTSWVSETNTVPPKPIMIVDIVAPVFVEGSPIFYNTYDVDHNFGNYVIPGQGVSVEFDFTDENDYYYSKPVVLISDLDKYLDPATILAVFGPSVLEYSTFHAMDIDVWRVPPTYLEPDPVVPHQWNVVIPVSAGLKALPETYFTGLMVPWVNPLNTRIFLFDLVWNKKEGGTFVTVTTDGPPVPLVIDARFEVLLNEGSPVPAIQNYLVLDDIRIPDTTQPYADQRLAVYIYTSHPANITDLTALGGSLAYGAMGLPIALTAQEIDDYGFAALGYTGHIYRVALPLTPPTTSFLSPGEVVITSEAYVIPPPALPVFSQTFKFDESVIKTAPPTRFNLVDHEVNGLGGVGKDIPLPAMHPDFPVQVVMEIEFPTEAIISGLPANRVLTLDDLSTFDFATWFTIDHDPLTPLFDPAVYAVDYDTFVSYKPLDITYYNSSGVETSAPNTENLGRIIVKVAVIVQDDMYDKAPGSYLDTNPTGPVRFAMTYQNVFMMERGFITNDIFIDSGNPEMLDIVLLDADGNVIDSLVNGTPLPWSLGHNGWLYGDGANTAGIPELKTWSIIRVYFDTTAGIDDVASKFSFLPMEGSNGWDQTTQMAALIAAQEVTVPPAPPNPNFYNGESGFHPINGAYYQFDLGQISPYMSAFDLWIGPYTIVVDAVSNFGIVADPANFEADYDFMAEEGIINITNASSYYDVPTNTLSFYTKDKNTVLSFDVHENDGTINEVIFRVFQPDFAKMLADGILPVDFNTHLYYNLNDILGSQSTLTDLQYWTEVAIHQTEDISSPIWFDFDYTDIHWLPTGWYAEGPSWISYSDTFAPLADYPINYLLRVTAVANNVRSVTEKDYKIAIFDNGLIFDTEVVEVSNPLIPIHKKMTVAFDYEDTTNNIIPLHVDIVDNGNLDKLRYIDLRIDDNGLGGSIAGQMFDGVDVVASTYPGSLLNYNDLVMNLDLDLNYYAAYAAQTPLKLEVWATLVGFLGQTLDTEKFVITIRFLPLDIGSGVSLYYTEKGVTPDDLLLGVGPNNRFGFSDASLLGPDDYIPAADMIAAYPGVTFDPAILGFGLAENRYLDENDRLIRVEASFNASLSGNFQFAEVIEKFRVVYFTKDLLADDPDATLDGPFDVTPHPDYNTDLVPYLPLTPGTVWYDTSDYWHYANDKINLKLVLDSADFDNDYLTMKEYYYFIDFVARDAFKDKVVLPIRTLAEIDLDESLNNRLVLDYRPPNLIEFAPVLSTINWKTKQVFEGTPALGADIIDFEMPLTIGAKAEWRIPGMVDDFGVDIWHEDTVFSQTYDPMPVNRFLAYLLDITGADIHKYVGEYYEGPIFVRVTLTDGPGNSVIYSWNNITVDNNPPSSILSWYTVVDDDATAQLPIVQTVIDPVTGKLVTKVYEINQTDELKVYVDNPLNDLTTVRLYYREVGTTPWVYWAADTDGTYGDGSQFEFWLTRGNKFPVGTYEFVGIGQDAIGNLEGVYVELAKVMENFFTGEVNNPIYKGFIEDVLDKVPTYWTLEGSDTRDLTLNLLVNQWFTDAGWDDSDPDFYQDPSGKVFFPKYFSWLDTKPIEFTIQVINDVDGQIAVTYPANNSFVRSQILLGADVTGSRKDEAEEVEFYIDGVLVGSHLLTDPINHRLVLDYQAIAYHLGKVPFENGVFVYEGPTLIGKMIPHATEDYWFLALNGLTQGNHTYSFYFDLDNNNVIDATDLFIYNQIIDVKPFALSLDTRTLPNGICEFTAKVINSAYPFNSITTTYFVDNKAPVIAEINAKTEPISHYYQDILYVKPGANANFSVQLDPVELLVAQDDFVGVAYQWSPDNPTIGGPFVYRRWFDINMVGDTWTALNPLTDGLDNDGDGIIDNLEEANARYYIRAIATDKAGNFSVFYGPNDDYHVVVDGTTPVVTLYSANGTLVTTAHNIINIPKADDGVITLVGNFVPVIPTEDKPVTATIWVRKAVDTFGGVYGNWTQITEKALEPDASGNFTFDWEAPFLEGYYQIAFLAEDLVGNTQGDPIGFPGDPLPNATTVVLNDIYGRVWSEIVKIGTRDVVEGANLVFGKDLATLQGTMTVNADYAVLTEEYFLQAQWSYDGLTDWTDSGVVNSGPYLGKQDNVVIDWTIDSVIRGVTDYYVRVAAFTSTLAIMGSEPILILYGVEPYEIDIIDLAGVTIIPEALPDPEMIYIQLAGKPGFPGTYTNIIDLSIIDPNTNPRWQAILDNSRINEMKLFFNDGVNEYYFLLIDPETFVFGTPVAQQYVLGQVYDAATDLPLNALPLGVEYVIYLNASDLAGNDYTVPYLESKGVYHLGYFDIYVTELNAGLYNEILLGEMFNARLNDAFEIKLHNDGLDVADMKVYYAPFDLATMLTTGPRVLIEGDYRLGDIDPATVQLQLNNHPTWITDVDSGIYQLTFVGPFNIEYTNVLIQLDNIAPDVEVTGAPAYLINTEPYSVTFTVNPVAGYTDEINPESISLKIAEVPSLTYTDAPTGPGYLVTLTRHGVGEYTATFINTAIPTGEYRLKLVLADNAVSVGNFTEADFPGTYTYILDDVDPEMEITALIVNAVNILTDPVRQVKLGGNFTVTAQAFDYEDPLAVFKVEGSGIDHFTYTLQYDDGFGWVDVLTDIEVPTDQATTPFPAPYTGTFTFPTSGMLLGDYKVIVVAWDKAGNESLPDDITLEIIAPDDLAPFALINAISYRDEANESRFYLTVDSWNTAVTIDKVTVEQFNDVLNVWQLVGFVTSPLTPMFDIQFNPASMINVTRIRTTVEYDGGMISPIMPELEVMYIPARAGAEVAPTNQNISISLWWDGMIHVEDAARQPIVTRITEDAIPDPTNRPVAYNFLDAMYQGHYELNTAGTYVFWAAAYDAEHNLMQLNRVEKIVAHNVFATDLKVTVLNGDVAYLQDLLAPVSIETGYTDLGNQMGITIVGGGNTEITMVINPLPVNVPLVGGFFNGDEWIYIPVTTDGFNVTMVGNASGIYTVFEATPIIVEFWKAVPMYDDGTDLWTTVDTTIQFHAYLDGAFVPTDGSVAWMDINGDIFPATYEQGVIELGVNFLVDINTVTAFLTRNVVTGQATQIINVDYTAPIITVLGGTLPVDNSVFATIVDAETLVPLESVILTIAGRVIPFAALDVVGDVYTYTLNLNDLQLVGNEFDVVWTATNHLGMQTISQIVTYNVNVGQPIVRNITPNNPYYYPGMEFSFEVVMPYDSILADNGVTLRVEEYSRWVNDVSVVETVMIDVSELTLHPTDYDNIENVYTFAHVYNTPPQSNATLLRFYIEARDNYGNLGTGEITYGVDEQLPPVVVILNSFEIPFEVSDVTTITANMYHEIGIAAAEMHIVSNTFDQVWNYTYDPALVNATISENIDLLANGLYTVTVTAWDTRGNSAADHATFTVTRGNPPEITILSPTEGQNFNVGDTVGIIAQVTDIEDGIDVVTLTVTGPQGFTIPEYDVPTDIREELVVTIPGEYTIVVYASDNEGNEILADRHFVVVGDTEAPMVTITAPVENQEFVLGNTAGIMWVASDNIAVVEARLTVTGPDGIIFVDKDVAGISADEVELLVAGSYTAQIVVKDAVGLEGSDVVHFFVLPDNEAPVVNITAPFEGQIFYGTIATIVASATDNGAIDSVDMIVEGPEGLIYTPAITDFSLFSVDLTGLVPGDYSATIVAIDKAGNTNTPPAVVHFSVQGDDENPTVEIFAPTEGQIFYVGNTAGIVVNASDNDEVVRIVISATGPSGVLIDNEVFLTAQVTTELPLTEAGSYSVTAVAFDRAGLQSQTAVVHFDVEDDTEIPVIYLAAPFEDQEFNLGEIVTILGTVTDNGVIAEVLLSVTNVLESKLVDENIVETLPALEPGYYTIQITAKDTAGNSALPVVGHFTVLGVPPVVTVVMPDDEDFWLAATIKNDITFTVEGVDQAQIEAVNVEMYLLDSDVPFNSQIPTLDGAVYTAVVQGATIPADQLGIKLNVVVTVDGVNYASGFTFAVDYYRPVVVLRDGMDGTVVEGLKNFLITAQIYDLQNGQPVRGGATRYAASGIAEVILKVYAPDGTSALEEVYGENTQVVEELINLTQFGTYIGTLRAKDIAGNETIADFSIKVLPNERPNLTFLDLENGDWVNIAGPNPITFVIDEYPIRLIASAVIIALPSETELVNVDPVNLTDGEYIVPIHGTQIPLDATSIKITVTLKDDYNNEYSYSRIYYVDREVPEILYLNPADGTVFTEAEGLVVNVSSEFTDNNGIASARLTVTTPAPENITSLLVTTEADVLALAYEMNNLKLGIYTLTLTVYDKVGNSKILVHKFEVVKAPIDPKDLKFDSKTPPIAYPNPGTAANGVSFKLNLIGATGNETVNIKIFDFAGREVVELLPRRVADGDIVWDAKTTNGTRVARGTYFARITVTNGTKIVESVVKVAIIN